MSRRGAIPLIGITCEAAAVRGEWDAYELHCDHRYALAVKNAGGYPILLPITKRPDVMNRYLDEIDGLVIVGGDDVDPRLYGEEPSRHTRVMFKDRIAFETWLYRESRKKRLPLFAICYGMQLVNVLEGGTLRQHIRPKTHARVVHRRGRDHVHQVHIVKGSGLHRTLRMDQAHVATEHHQAVKVLGRGFSASAVADDGIIEAMERDETPEILAVQWHPERSPQTAVSQRLFTAFVRRCRRYRAAKERAGPGPRRRSK